MRTNIYYWKCDNPLPAEEKLIYNDKYRLADVSDVVYEATKSFFGEAPLEVKPTGSSGNHYAYVVKYKDREVFFRADDGKIDDDYMEAEAIAMRLASKVGVPVPYLYFTDTTKLKFPFRYQIMEKVPGEPMKGFYQAGTLKRDSVSRELGRHLARLHSVELDGFGFFNTEKLRADGKVLGLDKSHKDYFNKRLGDHLQYLRDARFLSFEQVDEIEELFQRHERLLDLRQGSLVHKDIAYWNLVGTPEEINAIVDWDDVISGDPVDDLAVVRCFYDEDVFSPLLEGYQEDNPLPTDFWPKLWLFLVRNMLWKAVFRSFMRYFDIQEKVDLLVRGQSSSLKEFTYSRLRLGVEELKKI